MQNKTLSLFLRTQISKNGGSTELIQKRCYQKQCPTVLDVIWSVFTLASLALRANLYWREHVCEEAGNTKELTLWYNRQERKPLSSILFQK